MRVKNEQFGYTRSSKGEQCKQTSAEKKKKKITLTINIEED